MLVGLVEGLDGLLEDGLHPRPPLVPQTLGDANHRVGRAVPVGEDAGIEEVDSRRSPVVGQVDEPHLVYERLRHLPEQAAHQVCVGVDDDDGVRVPARRLFRHLVGDDVVHEGGLAHAGPCHVEVVPPQQVVGEVDEPGLARRGLSHRRASPDASGRGHQHPGPGPLHQGRLVPGPRRVPQGRRLPNAQDAALAEQSGACRVHRRGVGYDGSDPARSEPRPGGVVVVAVGRRHRLQQFLRPPPPLLLVVRRGHDHRDLYLGVEGDAGHLLLDEQGVVDAGAGLLEAVPGPAADAQGEGDPRTQERGLPGLPGLHPQVALEGGQGRHAQDGHRHAVGLEGLGLVGVGWVPALLDGPLVGLLHVGLGPVGAEGAQHQPRHDALVVVQVGQRAQQRDQGVRAGVEQVVVPEGAQGDVLGAVGPERHGPRLLAFAQAQGVFLRR